MLLIQLNALRLRRQPPAAELPAHRRRDAAGRRGELPPDRAAVPAPQGAGRLPRPPGDRLTERAGRATYRCRAASAPCILPRVGLGGGRRGWARSTLHLVVVASGLALAAGAAEAAPPTAVGPGEGEVAVTSRLARLRRARREADQELRLGDRLREGRHLRKDR